MSKCCEFTGKKAMVGNNVSHAQNKTKRHFLPNVNRIKLPSDSLQQSYQFRISNAALRTVEKKGGLDQFILSAKDHVLSPRALKIKRDIMKTIKSQTASNNKN